jgi:hypothetical protein
MKPFRRRKGLAVNRLEIIGDMSQAVEEAAVSSRLTKVLQDPKAEITNVLKDRNAAAKKAYQIAETMYSMAVAATPKAKATPRIQVVSRL